MFTGTFKQDEPGLLPPRYSGTMKAQINCSFTFLSIVQAGQRTVKNISFRKTPCVVTTKPLARLNLILYKKRFVADSSQARSCPSPFECVVRNGAMDKQAIQVKIYDWIHSQERFIVTVLPTKR